MARLDDRRTVDRMERVEEWPANIKRDFGLDVGQV